MSLTSIRHQDSSTEAGSLFQSPASTLSTLERLPGEILGEILSSLPSAPTEDTQCWLIDTLPGDPNSKKPSSRGGQHILACLLTSRTLYTAALPLLYQNVSICRLSTMKKFAAQLEQYPDIGRFVWSFDVSKFGLQRQALKAEDEFAECLLRCLSRIPMLHTLCGPAFCNERLDKRVVELLLGGGFPRLKTLDWELGEVLEPPGPTVASSITSLKLRGGNKNPRLIRKLLSAIPCLKHLDLASSISTEALLGIPLTAKVTRLTLSSSKESKNSLFQFMEARPAIASRLEVLHFSGQALPQSQNPESVNDPDRLLRHLPPTLRSLDLSPFTITPSRISNLRQICTHVSELRIGRGLHLHHLESILLPELDLPQHEDLDDHDTAPAQKHCPVLTPMSNAIAICKLRQRLALIKSVSPTKLRYLDIRAVEISEQRKLKMSVLLGKSCAKLQVIEFSEGVCLTSEGTPQTFGAVGWKVVCRARRYWIERK